MIDSFLTLFSLAISLFIGYIVGKTSRSDIKQITKKENEFITYNPTKKYKCRRKGCNRECYGENELCIDHAFGM